MLDFQPGQRPPQVPDASMLADPGSVLAIMPMPTPENHSSSVARSRPLTGNVVALLSGLARPAGTELGVGPRQVGLGAKGNQSPIVMRNRTDRRAASWAAILLLHLRSSGAWPTEHVF